MIKLTCGVIGLGGRGEIIHGPQQQKTLVPFT